MSILSKMKKISADIGTSVPEYKGMHVKILDDLEDFEASDDDQGLSLKAKVVSSFESFLKPGDDINVTILGGNADSPKTAKTVLDGLLMQGRGKGINTSELILERVQVEKPAEGEMANVVARWAHKAGGTQRYVEKAWISPPVIKFQEKVPSYNNQEKEVTFFIKGYSHKNEEDNDLGISRENQIKLLVDKLASFEKLCEETKGNIPANLKMFAQPQMYRDAVYPEYSVKIDNLDDVDALKHFLTRMQKANFIFPKFRVTNKKTLETFVLDGIYLKPGKDPHESFMERFDKYCSYLNENIDKNPYNKKVLEILSEPEETMLIEIIPGKRLNLALSFKKPKISATYKGISSFLSNNESQQKMLNALDGAGFHPGYAIRGKFKRNGEERLGSVVNFQHGDTTRNYTLEKIPTPHLNNLMQDINEEKKETAAKQKELDSVVVNEETLGEIISPS